MDVLVFVKYFNFFADSLIALASTLRGEVSYTALHIVLPVGISFYLFQTTSYVFAMILGLQRMVFAGAIGMTTAIVLVMLSVGYSPFIYFQF